MVPGRPEKRTQLSQLVANCPNWWPYARWLLSRDTAKTSSVLYQKTDSGAKQRSAVMAEPVMMRHATAPCRCQETLPVTTGNLEKFPVGQRIRRRRRLVWRVPVRSTSPIERNQLPRELEVDLPFPRLARESPVIYLTGVCYDI